MGIILLVSQKQVNRNNRFCYATGQIDKQTYPNALLSGSNGNKYTLSNAGGLFTVTHGIMKQ